MKKRLTKLMALILSMSLAVVGIPKEVMAKEVVSENSIVVEDARDELVTYGDAVRLEDGSIQLTELSTWCSGSAWYGHQIDATEGFETSFSFWAGGGRNDSYGGADGIVLTFSEENGLGDDGGYLGFVTGEKSYGVELDSYPHNSNDPAGKHVAIIHQESSNHLCYVADDRVDDSAWHNLKVVYDSANTTLKVTLDEEEILVNDTVTMADKVYLGISASTGSGLNRHLIKDFYINGVVSAGTTFNNNPIIVVPGIMGSRLFKSNTKFDNSTKVWDPIAGWNTPGAITGLNKNLDMDKTLYVRPCENQNIDLTVEHPESTVDDYGREYGAQDTYKDIVDSLCETFTYKDENNYRPIYVFSYDWRKSNNESAANLAKAIESVIAETGKEQVDIVCHSMGGLVTSKYFTEYASDGYVDRIITCGTPYEGAPKLINSVMNWQVLSDGGFNLNNAADKLLAILGGMNKKLKASFNGVVELTPTKNYVSKIAMQKDSWKPFSLGDYELSYSEYVKICEEIFGETKYTDAVSFQQSLHGANSDYNTLLNYDKAYFVIGTNHKTISSIKFQWSNNDVDQKLYESDIDYDILGDGTVPYLSASITEQVQNLDVARWETFNADHGETINKKECIEWLTDILNYGDSYTKGAEPKKKKYTVIRVACPVDVTIEKNGEIISSDTENVVVDASYGRLDVLGENDEIKMLCIDSDDYNVTVDGTGVGTMDYTIRFFDEEGVLNDERTFEDVPVTENTVIHTGTDENEDTMLEIDTDGNGVIDKTITAKENQVVDGNGGEKTPSQSTVTIGKTEILKVSNTAKGVSVKWNKVNGADGYYVYRKTGSKAWTQIATVASNSYQDKKAKKNGTKYQYQICAYKNVNGTIKTGEASAVKTTYFLSNPTSVKVKNVSGKKLSVSWKKNSKCKGYQIKYVTGKKAKTVTVNGKMKTDKILKGLKQGKTYKVYIRSYKKADGKKYYSAWSKVKKIKIKK